jgi:hypothetical protein
LEQPLPNQHGEARARCKLEDPHVRMGNQLERIREAGEKPASLWEG